MDRMISMITRRFIGRLVNKGVDAGIDKISRGGKKDDPTAQDRGQHNTHQQGGRQPKVNKRLMRQTMRTLRRMTRF